MRNRVSLPMPSASETLKIKTQLRYHPLPFSPRPQPQCHLPDGITNLPGGRQLQKGPLQYPLPRGQMYLC